MTVDRIAGVLAPEPLPTDPSRGPPWAAVSVVLHSGRAGPELLMIRRADVPGDPWSGHMAFPGGRLGAAESPWQAAIRETHEEVGLDLRAMRHLGVLDPVFTGRVFQDRRIDPFVFSTVSSPGSALADGGRPVLRLDAREVASVHWFGLDRLLADEGRGVFPFEWRGTPVRMPCIRLDGCLIWGLSLRMIDDLLERLR